MRLAFVFFFVLSTLGFAQEFTNDSSGFERQYRAAFDAGSSGSRDQIRHALDSFALPAEWFQQTFGADADQQLQQYKTEFDYFEYAESRHIQDEFKEPIPVMEVNVLPHPSPVDSSPKPVPVSLQPLPDFKWMEIKILDQSGVRRFSWMNTYAYVNGAFHFFGVGAYPFWDPRRIHRSDTCDPQGHQPGGHLTAPVTPIYPEEARSKGVQGTVSLVLDVAKDGSVSSVEVLHGDPLFAESASAAAKQWRYQPFTNCGEAMEGQSAENVRYSLDGSIANVTIVPPSMKVRISSGVAASNLVHKVNPKYPQEAKHARIQGAVVLKVLLDKEGKPQEVTTVSGAQELAEAAIDAVKQWRYKPYNSTENPSRSKPRYRSISL
jgi:TonB family protein